MNNLKKILVTGGAGFIGSHTVDILIKKGYEVTILDNLESQVHGKQNNKPDYLNKKATFIQQNYQNKNQLKKIIKQVDGIVHLAALVGVGQSMYQIGRYISGNSGATANLLDVLVNTENKIKKLVVASSMSVYGEGKYFCENCKEDKFPDLRDNTQLTHGQFDQICPTCNTALKPLPTDEDKPLNPTSIYAQSKHHQEEMCLLVGKTYGIPTVALRYFNVYGSRQSLSNPYTGACAIFTSRILNNKPPFIFEDGKQIRDFIHVSDIASANLQALESTEANYEAVNIGTGTPHTIIGLAEELTKLYDKSNLKPYVSNQYRKGDIRHCYADIKKAKELLNFKPKTNLSNGLIELSGWAKRMGWGAIDDFEKALAELKEKELAS